MFWYACCLTFSYLPRSPFYWFYQFRTVLVLTVYPIFEQNKFQASMEF